MSFLILLPLGRESALYAQAAGSAAAADSPSVGAQVRFTYDNPQLQPAKYSFVIEESGAGHFHSEPGATPPADTTSYHPLAQPQDRAVQLTSASTEKIFSTARAQKFFAGTCVEPKGKIAYQGTKQLSYSGPDGNGSCTYNWSKVVPIQDVTSFFESIAFTLEEGRRLELEHKHDRLSMDAEMAVLLDAVKDGRACELQIIEPTLKGIIDDETVMERVRNRAHKLLDAANATASVR